MRTKADSPTKTCGHPGCDRPLRARGLCSTHYNRERYPDRHARVMKPCEVCGTPVLRDKQDRYRTACSIPCRNLLTFGREAATTGRAWEDWAAARARAAGATIVEHISREVVGTRDHWTCQICHHPTNRDADPLHPSAPTIDHIVPLSRGGQHTMTNVQLACYSCNSRKQDQMTGALASTNA